LLLYMVCIMALSSRKLKEIERMHRGGWSWAVICEELQISWATVEMAIAKMGSRCG
jgi:DNA-binding NarL/FixJ family response regulator